MNLANSVFLTLFRQKTAEKPKNKSKARRGLQMKGKRLFQD